MADKEIYLVCSCYELDHMLVLSSYEDESDFYINVKLNNLSFWSRLKYLFGWKSKYGDWVEFVFTKQHADKIINFLKEKYEN